MAKCATSSTARRGVRARSSIGWRVAGAEVVGWAGRGGRHSAAREFGERTRAPGWCARSGGDVGAVEAFEVRADAGDFLAGGLDELGGADDVHLAAAALELGEDRDAVDGADGGGHALEAVG